jgi:tetratricopeptide (TPR) repeat protein
VEPGTVVDARYRIIAPLGSGGMGTVYRAEHVHIRREVALKIVHAAMGKFPLIGERFEREARAIGKLQQENCVGVQDFGQLEDSSLYLAMELVEGTPLDRLIDPARPLPWRRVLHIARHVLAGLAHAHAAGIVHRDIKPENIILTAREGDGDFAKILDFGLAKLIGQSDERELTVAGTAFGTPTYMAPEQAVGDPIDGRADLYALSVMMYELMTGRPPFAAEDKLSLLAMHTGKAAPPMPPELGIPAAVEALVMRGLEKKPAHRYADAAAYVAAIDRACADPNTAPAPRAPLATTTASTELPPAARWKWMAIAATGAAVLAIVALILTGGEHTGNGAEDDADALVVLGHRLAAEGKHDDALDAYQRALRAQPSLVSDDGVRDYLTGLASTSKHMATRGRARDIALGLDLTDRIDLLASYTRDLEQGKTCADRKRAIPKLRELGDKRAIRALERAKYIKGGVRFDRKNLNACLASDAREAIAHLKSLSPTPTPK